MFHVVLYQPEIAPNTGNIIRLCVNTGATLHLIAPLGFELDDARLRRAGLDYRERAVITVHDHFETYLQAAAPPRVFAFSTHHEQRYTDVQYRDGDALLFGSETRGLPARLRQRIPASHRLTVPMQPGNRSLNLSNTVAIAVYEAWRQTGFEY